MSRGDEAGVVAGGAGPPVRYRIEHVTAYEYSAAVTVSHHVARLRPWSDARQEVVSFAMEVDPVPALSGTDRDYFGNVVERFFIHGTHDRLEVVARSEVVVRPAVRPAEGGPAWEEVRRQVKRGRSADELAAYEACFASALVPSEPGFAAYAAPSFPAGRPLLEGVMALTERLNEEFKFDPAATTVTTPVKDVLARKRGVCQDFAQVEIACLRSLGLPARYVSGYLRTDPPPGRPRLVGADATHAWVAVYCPGAGWVEYDPTNRCAVGDAHIRVAVGRDFSDVSPLRGTVVGGGCQELDIGVTVTPLDGERRGVAASGGAGAVPPPAGVEP